MMGRESARLTFPLTKSKSNTKQQNQNQNPVLPNNIASMFTPLHSKVYLVTGANTGLGLDATRQLALKASTKKVYLACRTESKARQAIAYLLENHKIPPTKLDFVLFNASDSNTEIAKIVDALPADEKLDGLIFNAGGIGSDKTGVPTGPNHVLDQIQINIIGHIHLLNVLKSAGFASKDQRDSNCFRRDRGGSQGCSDNGTGRTKASKRHRRLHPYH
jgi:NAD(P)-dependent dehydrogenase (short-subunit alcohol dehydrogenase family)